MKERYLFAIDLDGTLLSWNKKLSQKNRQVLLEAQKQGHLVMLATGRAFDNTLKYAKELKLQEYGGYVAAYNGSLLFDFKNDQVLVENNFDQELLEQILAYLDSEKLDFTAITNEEQYISDNNKRLVDIYRKSNGKLIRHYKDAIKKNPKVKKILINDFKSKLLLVRARIQDLYGEKISISMSSIISLEITPKNSNKGYALEHVANLESVDMKNTIAIGNQGNDIPMLEKAGKAVAVKNSSRLVKSHAKVITDSNNRDGVANFIEKFLRG